ncbi:flagellar hook capping protein [Pseudarthrobacter sp. AG30]|uniref:flagellar hook assembly protein FlgD n=1 Tax=Pseudarthrobacter sp. AG30 TaxID=2249742 RepID=UPI000D65BACD|nr:flagellar hook capping FlgD N-terminal domain-containing protein [Pseudarthrobacter sp. AG30]RAX16984.1 flagellar hook capping protein [Pseudarthrobacter sp. AG30]
MTVEAVGATTGIQAGATARKPVQSMDSDVFMKLLVTQLKYQDPGAPMDTNQMMAQSVQLSMMEKMTELSGGAKESFSLQMRTAAAQIVGSEVGYTLADGTTGSGVASAVSFATGVPLVTVGAAKVPLDSLTGISASAPKK